MYSDKLQGKVFKITAHGAACHDGLPMGRKETGVITYSFQPYDVFQVKRDTMEVGQIGGKKYVLIHNKMGESV